MRFTKPLLCILPFLAQLALSASTQSPTDQIRNTISQFSILLERKDFTLLPKIFTPDATFTLKAVPGGLGSFKGIGLIEAGLRLASGSDNTISAINYQVIEIDDAGLNANATTGVVDYHFKTGNARGQMGSIWSSFADQLSKTNAGWRISRREVVNYAGPFKTAFVDGL